jgi:hypothetical protein
MGWLTWLFRSPAPDALAVLERENAALRSRVADLEAQVTRAYGVRVVDLPAAAPVDGEMPAQIPATPAMPPARPPAPVELGSGSDAFAIPIVGESHRQVALRRLAGDRRKRGLEVTFTAVLIPEPHNEYDPNAVRVNENGGPQLGYLSRDDAAAYAAVFQALHQTGRFGACRAKLVGGTKGKPSIGVVLDLDEPEVILARLAEPPVDQPF